MSARNLYSVAPSAARLTDSLRDIGYDFPTAVADVVDNSVAAGASRVEIDIVFDGSESWVMIADDGEGMSANGLLEALRYGSRRDYGRGDLGRYGLGLKTASLSQCRSLTVVSRRRVATARTVSRMIDLDLIAEVDDWVVAEPANDEQVAKARETVADTGGTVVLWRGLDRVLPERKPEGGWARRRLEALAGRTADHLGTVFHRFLEGEVGGGLVITVNGEKVRPWNPFAPNEPSREVLPPLRFEVTVGEATGTVSLQRYVLPSRDQFSSQAEFERLSGPLNWNRQQGLYVYRAQRLVQWGGWNGMRGIDEHTKLARAALDFDTDLDVVFNINVAKIRVAMPPQLRQLLERPVHELCMRADDAYRKTSRVASEGLRVASEQLAALSRSEASGATPPMPVVGLALRAAAMRAGEYAALQRIGERLRAEAPDVAAALGFRD
ncbi:ATP-binding protein [Micromonospora peucetia]|uniref:ATP-binding protein n=1 Tax=Micromonospora peucetia TaxID=47871 RepID=A0ABZ1EJ88_9ACTN|nr:ATP-binding protein [Micromonospora peucetia]WSA34313.1 ATP-binding protein [Micromonospora peucetia]